MSKELRTIKSLIVSPGVRKIFLKSGENVNAGERKKRLGEKGCIWTHTASKIWPVCVEWINQAHIPPAEPRFQLICDGLLMRAGISAGVIINKKSLALVRYDEEYLQPLSYTPAAGIHDTSENYIEAALRELGEELIVSIGKGIGAWMYKGKKLALNWVKDFVNSNDLIRLPRLNIKVEPFEVAAAEIYQIFLDNQDQGSALVAFEFETGSIELVFMFQAIIPDDITLIDGEMHKGKYLHREAGVYTLEDLSEKKLTTKAQALVDLLKFMQAN